MVKRRKLKACRKVLTRTQKNKLNAKARERRARKSGKPVGRARVKRTKRAKKSKRKPLTRAQKDKQNLLARNRRKRNNK